MLDSKEISSHIAYLTSDDSSFLTGQNIVVDGGDQSGNIWLCPPSRIISLPTKFLLSIKTLIILKISLG